MNISDVVNITNGELVGTPKIQSIKSATVYPSKVEFGDLFFALNQEDADGALNNGAYAIVYDDENIIKHDNEIAWIKVSDVKLATIKLIRYVLLKKEIDIYLLNSHELSFLKMITLDKRNITILSQDWRKTFEQIVNSDNLLFVGDDEELMTNIKPNIAKLESQKDYQLVSDTLFKCSFKIDGYVYQNYDIAPFHMEHLAKILDFLDKYHIRYDLEKIRYTKHFVPVFIDNQLQIQSSSKSEKVVIFVDNLQDIYQANEYIYYRLKWIRSIILAPKKTKIDLEKNPVWFDNVNDVHQKLKTLTYNYAFVYNLDKSILPTLQQEYDLFNQ